MASGIHDDTNMRSMTRAKVAQDMHTYEFCARMSTKWNLIFQGVQDMHTYEFCARDNNKVDIVFSKVFKICTHMSSV